MHFGKFIIIILFVPQLDIFFLLTADNCLILLFTPTANYETTCYLTISFCIVSTVLSFVCLFLQLITMAEVD